MYCADCDNVMQRPEVGLKASRSLFTCMMERKQIPDWVTIIDDARLQLEMMIVVGTRAQTVVLKTNNWQRGSL